MAFDDYRQWLRSQAARSAEVGRPCRRQSVRHPVLVPQQPAPDHSGRRGHRLRWRIRLRPRPACARSSSTRVVGCSAFALCRRSSTTAPLLLRHRRGTRCSRPPGCRCRRFVEAPPQWAPPDFADVRAAWTGPHPALKDVTLRIEGGRVSRQTGVLRCHRSMDRSRTNAARQGVACRSGVRRADLRNARRADCGCRGSGEAAHSLQPCRSPGCVARDGVPGDRRDARLATARQSLVEHGRRSGARLQGRRRSGAARRDLLDGLRRRSSRT